MTRLSEDPESRALALGLAHAAPRVIVLCAPAGYGKSAVIRFCAETLGGVTLCDLTRVNAAAELARNVLDALLQGDRSRAARSAADRLSQGPQRAAASAREALRREWPLDERAGVFALRDSVGLFATPAGVDLFDELVAALPPRRTLALVTRVPLPPALATIVAREPSATLGIRDLELSAERVLALAQAAGVSADLAAAVHGVARGWPLVSRLLIGLLGHDAPNAVLEAATALPHASMLAFAAHRTIARLGETDRQALAVASLMHGATHPELIRVVGDACDDVVFARLCDLPFVALEGDRACVHPEVAVLLRTRFAPLIRSWYERTLNALTGDGSYLAAARVALEGGDGTRAAAIIDAAPPYTSAPVPLGEYERIIERLDPSLIIRYPNVWIATIPFRAFHVDRAAFIREAETVFYCLPHRTRPELRAATLMLLASAYTTVGRIEEANALIEEALSGFAAAPSPARASVLNFTASLRGMEGRFALARSLAAEAAVIARDAFGEDQTLHYIDMHEAMFGGKNDRVVVIVDELLRRLGPDELPLHRAHAASNGALVTWVNGDDESFERYMALLAEALTPGIERGFAPMIDAARGLPPRSEEQFAGPLVEAIVGIYRLSWVSSGSEAVETARAAAAAADQRREPYVQILAHAALFVLDASRREAEASLLRAIVSGVESSEMRGAVDALLRGEAAGVLEPFLRRRVLRDRAVPAVRLTVELFAGRVSRAGTTIHLSDKEFQLVALLASSHGPVTRDRIGEAIWDHLDPEEWPNNIKVTMSRIRAKLLLRDAIVVSDGRYRLSPMIDVDLRSAEALVRAPHAGRLDESRLSRLRAALEAYHSGAAGRYARYAWAQAMLARMDDLLCTSGVLFANDAFAAGRFEEALRYASAVAAIDEFNEAVCELTMRVHAARGDLDAARRELARHAKSLAEGLGAAPSSQLMELARRLGIAGAERFAGAER